MSLHLIILIYLKWWNVFFVSAAKTITNILYMSVFKVWLSLDSENYLVKAKERSTLWLRQIVMLKSDTWLNMCPSFKLWKNRPVLLFFWWGQLFRTQLFKGQWHFDYFTAQIKKMWRAALLLIRINANPDSQSPECFVSWKCWLCVNIS